MECSSPGDTLELATDDVSDRIEPFQEIMLADFDWMMIMQG
jgi:hypothetical protein